MSVHRIRDDPDPDEPKAYRAQRGVKKRRLSRAEQVRRKPWAAVLKVFSRDYLKRFATEDEARRYVERELRAHRLTWVVEYRGPPRGVDSAPSP